MAGSLFGSIALHAPQTARPRPVTELDGTSDGYAAGLLSTSARERGHEALVLGDALVRTEQDVRSDDTAATVVAATTPLATTGDMVNLTHPIDTSAESTHLGGIAGEQQAKVPPGAAVASPSGGEEPWNPEQVRRFMLPRSDDPLQYVGAARKALGSKAWDEGGDFMNRST